MKKQRRTRVVIKTGFQTKFAVVRGSPMTNWKLQLLYFSKVSDMKHCFVLFFDQMKIIIQ